MALNYLLQYPAQILSGVAGYPYGKPRNVAVSGDGTGTPLEAAWLADLFGFLQSLLVAAGITLDPLSAGTPDKVGASDYLDAIRYLTKHIDGALIVNGTVIAESVLSSNGSFLGNPTTPNGFTASNFVGVQTFNNGWISQQEVTVNLGGIVVGPGGVVIGNGLDGIIILAGGLNVQLGDSSFTPPVTFHDEIVLADAGRIRKRTASAGNANANFDVTQTDVLIVPGGGTITAGRIYTLQNTGASSGSEVEVDNFSGFTHTIHNSGGVTIGTVPMPSGFVPGVLRFRYQDDGISGAHWVMVHSYTP